MGQLNRMCSMTSSTKSLLILLFALLSLSMPLSAQTHLRRGRPIEDCRANADCAPLLREPMLPAGDEKEQLRFAAYATGIALAFKGLGPEIPRNLCIEETSALVIDELKKRYANLAPAALCVVLPALNSEVPTGRPTLRVSADHITQASATRARADLMYLNSRRGGAGWTCEFERVPGAWRPVLCRHVWDY